MASSSPDGTRAASGAGIGYVVLLEALTPPEAGNSLPVSALRLDERYGSGWGGRAVIAFTSDSPITGGAALGLAGGEGIRPGHVVVVHLALAGTGEDDPDRGLIVRSWPCVVGKLEPFTTGLKSAGCHVGLIDPVTFLMHRPVWGAWRACSAGMMVGGALSSVAGGDGKPALQPILPGLPIVRIVEDYRDDLKGLPYAIAAGQSMGEWLDAFAGLLGLRVEMRGMTKDASVEVMLSDRKPGGRPMRMTLGPTSTTSGGSAGSGPLLVTGYSARPGMNARGGVLDDPAYGEFRPFGWLGAIERVFSEAEVGLEEANRRLWFPLIGAYTEMLAVDVMSRQPGFRPGRRITLSGGDIRGLDTWQLATVAHRVDAGRYENRAMLLRGDAAWHPLPPPPRAPLFVPGIIDGGTGLLTHEPVPRDRLGRIPVTFPFVPTPLGKETPPSPVADTNRDDRSTLDDFDAQHVRDDTGPPGPRDEAAAKHRAGDYASPDPNEGDSAPSGVEIDTDGVEFTRKYGKPFDPHDASPGGPDPHAAYGLDTEPAQQRWPPRIPLTIIEPMAGSLHGFIPAHRHRDSCRVAVHDPFRAEIIGFQYRADRQINAGIVGATAGLVVEHDCSDAWSGWVFRSTGDLESAQGTTGDEGSPPES